MRKTDATRSERRLEDLKAAAKEAGVKLTHQRLEIFRELARSEEHPDADTLYRAVQQRVPTVSLDTVYRTLWMLNDLGMVMTLGPGRDRVRFDVNLEHHHHFVCVGCGMVRDFDSADLNGLRIPDVVREFGTVVDAQVQVRGLCTKCQKKRKSASTRARPGAGDRSPR